jgi:nucleotide-binding universal stress UspA family protein
MSVFKVIYVPVDGSEGSIKATQTALAMAQPMDAKVVLLFAFPENAY